MIKQREYPSATETIAKTVEAACNDEAEGRSFPHAGHIEDAIDKALTSKEALKHEILKRIIADNKLEVSRQGNHGEVFLGDLYTLYPHCFEDVVTELEELGYIMYGNLLFYDDEGFKRYARRCFSCLAMKSDNSVDGYVTIEGALWLPKDFLADDGLEPTELVKEAICDELICDYCLDPSNLRYEDLEVIKVADTLNGLKTLFKVKITVESDKSGKRKIELPARMCPYSISDGVIAEMLSDKVVAKMLSGRVVGSGTRFPEAEKLNDTVATASRLRKAAEKEIMLRLVGMAKDPLKHFVELGDILFDSFMGDIVEELEELGYVYYRGKLYDSLEEFYHFEMLDGKVKFFSKDYDHEKDSLILKTFVQLPPSFLQGDSKIKQLYEGGIKWSADVETHFHYNDISIVNCEEAKGCLAVFDNLSEVTVELRNDDEA